MALDFPIFKKFKGLSARSRILILVGGTALSLYIIYSIFNYFFGGKPIGASQVATAPAGLQSVPGGKVSPEFYRAVMEANVQAAQQAKVSGQSAVPTLV